MSRQCHWHLSVLPQCKLAILTSWIGHTAGWQQRGLWRTANLHAASAGPAIPAAPPHQSGSQQVCTWQQAAAAHQGRALPELRSSFLLVLSSLHIPAPCQLMRQALKLAYAALGSIKPLKKTAACTMRRSARLHHSRAAGNSVAVHPTNQRSF